MILELTNFNIKKYFVISNNGEYLINHQNKSSIDLHKAITFEKYEHAYSWIVSHFEVYGFGGFYKIEEIIDTTQFKIN